MDEKYARNLQYEGYALGRSVEMGVVCGCVRLIWLNWMLDPIFKKIWFVKDQTAYEMIDRLKKGNVCLPVVFRYILR